MAYFKTRRTFITFHQRLLGFGRAARTRAFLISMGYKQFKGPWTLAFDKELSIQPMSLPVGLIFCPSTRYTQEIKGISSDV